MKSKIIDAKDEEITKIMRRFKREFLNEMNEKDIVIENQNKEIKRLKERCKKLEKEQDCLIEERKGLQAKLEEKEKSTASEEEIKKACRKIYKESFGENITFDKTVRTK
jgi:predicted nuclease with TOPRIM domain